MQLSGQQRRKLYEAIIDAFADRNELQRTVSYGLDERLDLIASNTDFKQAIFELIEWASREGRVEELMTVVRAEKPRNSGLRAVAEELLLAAPAPLPQQDIEKIVVASAHFSDAAAWRERMSTSELAVCRIEIDTATGTGYGTGFLLGPNLVITNHHVMQDVIADPALRSRVTLRFDYKVTPDGKTLNPGVEYLLASDWLVDDSPNNPSHRPPTTDELDYTLLCVEGTPGEDPIAGQTGAPARKWLTPKEHSFAPKEPLLIIQHPQLEQKQLTAPLQFALGIVDDPNPDLEGTRVTYTTNTNMGASGSPCFSDIWKLVALHHSGNLKRNEGIPFTAILARLERKGLRQLLA